MKALITGVTGQDEIAIHNAQHIVPEQVSYLLNLCKRRNVAIQAGGWKGSAPLLLSNYFSLVYTYEPSISNYKVLVESIGEKNIIPIFGLLWNEHGTGGLTLYSNNNSADYRSIPNGNIPRYLIDDLGLNECDLIWLDVQGDEYEAIVGALKTIKEYKPIIGFELARAKHKCPQSQDLNKYLLSLGYKYHGSCGLDRFYICAP